MSHFTVLVVLPKDNIQKIEDANKNKGDDEWHNAYNHQWFHPDLEEAMEPYFEQHEPPSPYCERTLDLNYWGTELMELYKAKDTDKLIEKFQEIAERRRGWLSNGVEFSKNEETGEFEKEEKNEERIQEHLAPLYKLQELMTSYSEFDFDLFKEAICDSDEVEIEGTDVYDVWYRNPNAKWDWWVVGGRWRSSGDNGLFKDIGVFSEEKQVPLWKEELGFKLYDIEKELEIDRENISQEEYDKAITKYIKSNEIVRFYDIETKEPREYYKPEDLLSLVTRKKETSFSYLFPEEGWIEAGEMGWFGTSSLDGMDLDEREEVKSDTFALTDNLIKKYKDTHIGLIVDCHI